MKPITNVELDFMDLVWTHEPVGSTMLVKLAGEKLGWKKSTTYTVIKKLGDKGVLVNCDAVVTSLVPRAEVAVERGEELLNKVCCGSINLLLTSFLQKETLTPDQAKELKETIDRFTREGA